MLLITSKKATTRNKHKTESPTIEQKVDIIREICAMKKMTCQLRVRENVFVCKRKKWMIYDTVEKTSGLTDT